MNEHESSGIASPALDAGGPKALVILPAFNEEATVGKVTRRVRAVGLDCLVVDDCSSDRTAAVAEDAGASVVRLAVNLGVGGALRVGFRFAVEHGYDVVVQCDADGQHPPEEIPRLLEALVDTSSHLLIGSRFLPGSNSFRVGRSRRALMRLLALLVRVRTGARITDTSSGFRCIATPLLGEFARSFPTHYLGDTFEAVLVAAKSGYRVAEIPVTMHERTSGVSTASPIAAVALVVRAVLVTLGGLAFRISRFEPDVSDERAAD